MMAVTVPERKLKSLYRGGRSSSAVPASCPSEGNLLFSSDGHFSTCSDGAVALLCLRLSGNEGARDADDDGVIDTAGLDERRLRRVRGGLASADENSLLTEEDLWFDGGGGGDDDDNVDEGGMNEYDEPVIVERWDGSPPVRRGLQSLDSRMAQANWSISPSPSSSSEFPLPV